MEQLIHKHCLLGTHLQNPGGMSGVAEEVDKMNLGDEPAGQVHGQDAQGKAEGWLKDIKT